MNHDCPVPMCFTTVESKDHLVDHITDSHDLFTALVNGELELSDPAAVADGGQNR